MEELAKKMAQLADQYGAHAVETTRAAAWMEAMSSLVANCITVAVGVSVLLLARWLWKQEKWFDGMNYLFAGIAFCLAVSAIGIGVSQLADPWLWATFKNPDLWIAKKVIGL